MRVEESILIDAGIDRVWDVVYDVPKYKNWMAGITRWDVEGRKRKGLGARYAMRMEVGSAEVGSLIEIVECDDTGDLAWTSITGLDQRGRWRLREREGEGTEVSLRISYQAPGGILGLISDRVSSPMVRANPSGAPLRSTRDPSLMPSFCGNGVPEYPAIPRL